MNILFSCCAISFQGKSIEWLKPKVLLASRPCSRCPVSHCVASCPIPGGGGGLPSNIALPLAQSTAFLLRNGQRKTSAADPIHRIILQHPAELRVVVCVFKTIFPMGESFSCRIRFQIVCLMNKDTTDRQKCVPKRTGTSLLAWAKHKGAQMGLGFLWNNSYRHTRTHDLATTQKQLPYRAKQRPVC